MGIHLGPPPRTPVALVDVDGVVAEFTPHLLRTISARVTPNEVTDWDIFGFLDDAEKAKAYALLKTHVFWETIPVTPHAKEGVAELRSRGFDVVWVTSPWYGCDTWEIARRAWLKTNFEANKRDIIVAPRKDVIHGDLFIDDKPEHIQTARAPSIVYDQAYNRQFDWPQRMHGWRDLARVLGE